MNRRALILALCCFCAVAALGQRHRLRIMEYNVENLFDTIPNPAKDDAAFTPQGGNRWNSLRYRAKLTALSRVVAGVGETDFPQLVALVEVENDSVVHHLAHRTKLRRAGYDYIVTHSPDVRGINVALLYQPAAFQLVGVDSVRVEPSSSGVRPTRDVLHVAGRLASGDTLDVMVVHFPSRKGGAAAKRYRHCVAARVRAFADSLMLRRAHPQLVVTGDFNAWFPETVFTEALDVKTSDEGSIGAHDLCLLSHKMKAAYGICGTYKYRGEWNQLDHFIVNGELLHNAADAPLSTSRSDCRIADFPFLLRDAGNEEKCRPYRTYLGPHYQGGYSDHLPLVLDLWMH